MPPRAAPQAGKSLLRGGWTHHDFVDQGAFAQGDELRPVEGGSDLAAGDSGDAFDAVEVRVLDGHHAGLAHGQGWCGGGEMEGNTERA